MLTKLVGVVGRRIGLPWGVWDELEKLKGTLKHILTVINNAERDEVKEEAIIRLWLRWINDIAYDAGDMMDELFYEVMRRSEESNYTKHKVLNLVSSYPLGFRFKIARRIKDINRSLEEIHKMIFSDHLILRSSFFYEMRRRPTTSFSYESEIVGREDDKNNIINLLLTTVTPSSSVDSVISIVGTAEVGKTALAQLVYRDELVKKQFDLRMWVHASGSGNNDVRSIFIKILESSTKLELDFDPESSALEVLMTKVKEQLGVKKYLLVLDNCWNKGVWGDLLTILCEIGAKGSKILVTTRSYKVASIVSLCIPYELKPLPDDAYWSIIEKKAFSPGGALNSQKLINIGKEIAKICRGLPVTAKFVGNLLHSKYTESDWISVRDGNYWNTPDGKKTLQPILKLSYINAFLFASPYAKQCFSFCSIFPKNWEINRKTLIQLWMAEGFLEPYNVDDKKSTEDIGNKFFHRLVSNSFFHYLEKNELGDIKTCKMHDSVQDLAKDVLWNTEVRSMSGSEDVSERRRLQLKLDVYNSATFLEKLSNGKKLRTIFISEASHLDPAIFSTNKHIRVLHVGRSPDPGLTKLSHLSFKMKYLRYLHLSSLDLSEVVCDQSISKLYLLQTLVLTHMSGAQNLLTNLHSLQNLRHLEISFTDMEILPDSVTSLPNLQSLDLNNCELKHFPDSITGLSSLTCLDMSFNPFGELPAFVLTLSHLQTLDINSCKNLKALPESVSGLENLKICNFKDCSLLEAVPQDLGALTELRSLDLRGTEIKVLPESCANLSKLELVHLYKCELPKEEEKWIYLKNLLGRGGIASTSQEASTSR